MRGAFGSGALDCASEPFLIPVWSAGRCIEACRNGRRSHAEVLTASLCPVCVLLCVCRGSLQQARINAAHAAIGTCPDEPAPAPAPPVDAGPPR